jgi:hypothetical protein
MRSKKSMTLLVFMVFCLLGSFVGIPSAYALETPLKTEAASPKELTGTYRLILYGHRFANDVETVAVFDREGDGYTFDVFAPDFDFKIKKDVPAAEALKEAQEFVSFQRDFWRSQLSKIIDSKGDVVGFELRPLYNPVVYGVSDILDVYYWPKENGRIKVTIKLIPSVEEKRFPGIGESPASGGMR